MERKTKITQHWVPTAARPKPGKTQIFYWDSALTGFGLCVSASDCRSFVVQKRIAKTARISRVVLGTWPVMTGSRRAMRPGHYWEIGRQDATDRRPAHASRSAS